MLCLQWFDSLDLDNDGMLNATELQRALAVGNLHFSLVTVAHMIRCITEILPLLFPANTIEATKLHDCSLVTCQSHKFQISKAAVIPQALITKTGTVLNHPAVCCRIQNHGSSNAISCTEFGRLHDFLTGMQHSFIFFGRSHPGQLHRSEAVEALQHAGKVSSTCTCQLIDASIPVFTCHNEHINVLWTAYKHRQSSQK